MRTLIAWMLSVLIALTASAPAEEQSSLSQKFHDSWDRLYASIQQCAAAEENTATVLSNTELRASPSKSARSLAQLAKGDTLTALRVNTVASVPWVYVHSDSLNLSGWVLASQLKLPTSMAKDVASQQTEESTAPTEETIPAYAKMGVVNTYELNIRTAPGVNNSRIGCYRYGDRVAILETRVGWGRTTSGWICLDYVYLDGDMGKLAMVGNVSADRLNIRSGPGTDYQVVGSYAKGDRFLIFEQICIGSTFWGCTQQGWISMSYIVPDVIPGTETPIYGFAYVKSNGLSIRSGAGVSYSVVGSLAGGELIPVWEVVTVDGVQWGHMAQGWIDMAFVTLTVTFDQGTPEEPTEPTTPEETQPEETTPEETEPEETTPEETKPEETTPEETKPEETEPEEPPTEGTPEEETTPEGKEPEETLDAPDIE